MEFIKQKDKFKNIRPSSKEKDIKINVYINNLKK